MFQRLSKWWNSNSVSVYPCLTMTGRTGNQVWRKYRKQRLTASKYGVRVNSPLPGEGIKDTPRVIKDRRGKGGTKIWRKDSGQIYRSNAILFEKDNMRSQGSIFELVKARGSLFKITVIVHPKPGFITREQGDVVAKSMDSALKQLAVRFGSRRQRFYWRMGMLMKSAPKFLLRQIKELWR